MARSLGSFRGESSIASWLYTIARRFCIKKRRRSKFAPAHEESLDAPGVDAAQRLADRSPNPEQAAADREVARMLTAAIDRLEPSQREVLVLRDVEGLSAPEVARIVGASVEAVKSRLHRARASVRRALLPLAGLERSEPDRAPGCPDVVTLFSQHLEGDLNPGMCATLEAHLAGCDRCRGRCDGLKRTLALCRQLPTPAVPPAIASSLRAAIRTFVDSR
jgi:RNA polymerase sigma-70 factor (ECF subfamily)